MNSSLQATISIEVQILSAARQSTVLIIDDQSACRATFKRILLSLDTNVEIETFSRPREALHWCEKNQPALIITDFRMPEMDGVELVQRFRDMPGTAQTPIIVSTITSDKAIKGRALNAGATDFLIKPIDHDECRARCRNLLALSEYQSLLREHIATLNHQINATVNDVRHQLPVHERSGAHIEVGYNELFALTSTVAAIDKLLEPLRTTISELEGAVQLPLVGQKSIAHANTNPEPNTHLFYQAAASHKKTRTGI